MKKSLLNYALLLCCGIAFSQSPKRKLVPSDVYKYQSLSNMQVSPDGKWVLYSVAIPDSTKNKKISDLHLSSWDGKDKIQLTFSDEGESNPKFSPDGKYIAYLSSKKVDSTDNDQIWLMDRRGGEAKQFTKVKEDLKDFAWSPDGSKMVLVMQEEEKKDKKSKTKPVIVVDKYHFKQDIDGYVYNKPTHLYLSGYKNW